MGSTRALVDKFSHTRFEPSSYEQEIPIAKSVMDYVFRHLGNRFLAEPVSEEADDGAGGWRNGGAIRSSRRRRNRRRSLRRVPWRADRAMRRRLRRAVEPSRAS